MICPRCLFRGSFRIVGDRTTSSGTRAASHIRPLSTSSIRAAQPIASGATASSTHQLTKNATTSTAAAQPFSTPLTPSAVALGVPTTGSKKSTSVTPGVVSSVPAGTPLKGLNYFKNKSDPIAMEDHEYPAWLWEVLTEKKAGAGDEKEEIDPRLFSKSAKARRMAAKRQRKNESMNPELAEKKIPIYEQSIDLPAGDGTPQGAIEALGARDQLTKAMRGKRRRDIKEANFLKSMS